MMRTRPGRFTLQSRHYLVSLSGLLALTVLILTALIGLNFRLISAPIAQADTYNPSLVFGTNLGLNDSNDQFYSQAAARTTLQQNHIQMARIPLRSVNGKDDDSLVVAAVQEVVNLGMVPVVVLHGPRDSTVVTDDENAITAINNAVGTTLVYYEYGNESDSSSSGAIVSKENYTDTGSTSWNTVIPQLHPNNGRFVGPVLAQGGGVNFDGIDDDAYLQYFLLHANPKPFAISWHEYTCGLSDADSVCTSKISNWTTHINNIRSFMSANLSAVGGSVLPIMITEWNFDASAGDPRLNNATFVTTWTNQALQTLIADQVFASMQYATSNASTQLLLNSNNTPTAQLTAMSNYYASLPTSTPTPNPTSTPTSSPSTPTATPTSIPTSTPTPLPTNTPTPGPTPTGGLKYSFEDGGLDGWSSTGDISSLTNSTAVGGQDGTHALKAVFTQTTKDDPVISVNPPNGPTAGQTVSAFFYIPSGASTTTSVKLYVQNPGNFQWIQANQVTISQQGSWVQVSFTPTGYSGNALQVGIQFFETPNNTSTTVYVDSVNWS